MDEELKYPVGRQSFEVLRSTGKLYVDKTDLVFQLVNASDINFFTRPRRFGKSLLISTLEAYFEGREELFEGLAIAKLETKWEKYPVLTLDFANRGYINDNSLTWQLNRMLTRWEELYGVKVLNAEDYAGRFGDVIVAAYGKTGRPVVVLIDEYDKPVLDAEGNDELQEANRALLRSFYTALKSNDKYLRFVFITGITKHVHVNIYSGLNNLKDISLEGRYATLCGFTEREIRENLSAGVEALAEKLGYTLERTYAELRQKYDGYCFSPENMVGVYNPFSLLLALDMQRLGNYWFASGTSAYLFNVLMQGDKLLHEEAVWTLDAEDMYEAPSETENPAALLYQAGYLTIARYDEETETYILKFPNGEVRVAFNRHLLRHIAREGEDVLREVKLIVRHLKRGEAAQTLPLLYRFFAGINHRVVSEREAHFQLVVLTLFRTMKADVQAEEPTSRGRIDLVVRTQKYVYIYEFKLDQPAADALAQIEGKGYAVPYAGGAQEVIKIGVGFSSATRNVDEAVVRRDGQEDAAYSRARLEELAAREG